jgi:hypothetical protein
MPDIFSVDARGRILRNPTELGHPASLAETTAVAYTLTDAEIAVILARPENDPVRVAYVSRPAGGSGGGGGIPSDTIGGGLPSDITDTIGGGLPV